MFLSLLLDFILMPGRMSLLQSGTVTYGVMFSLPVYFPSLSNVYNFPAPQNSIHLGDFSGIFSSTPFLAVLSALLFTAVVAFLAGGYLGSINAKRIEITTPAPTLAEFHTHSPGFLDLCIAHFARLFEFGVLSLGIVAIGAVFILLDLPGFAILYFLAALVVTYFLFLTPFVIVVDKVGLGASLAKSVRIASKKPSLVLPYVILYIVFTALVSVLVYAVMNGGVQGYVIDSLIYSVVGTMLVSATLVFYSDTASHSLNGRESEAPRSPETNQGAVL